MCLAKEMNPPDCGHVADLMSQDVDVMANIARGRGVLLLCVLTLHRRFHLDLALHVGLFDHLHLQQIQTVGTFVRGGRPLPVVVLYAPTP